MSEKPKKKRKKKKIIIISIFILLFFVLLFFIDNNRRISTIKKHYNSYVITTQKIDLYNEKKKKVGTISKGYPLELEKLETTLIGKQYFQLKDSNYFIEYDGVKKLKEIKKEPLADYLLPLNKKITSEKEITLYQENKKKITFSS